ncbi:MAG: response regulator [Armatimonadota bacterium]
MCRILIVDDEEEVRAAVQRRLSRDNISAEIASGETEGIEKINNAVAPYDVVLTDMVMENPDSGVNMLQAALGRDIFTEVIVLTAYGNVANAVECMKRGAFDYVEKNIPGVDVYDLMSIKVSQALERRNSSVKAIKRIDDLSKEHGEWSQSAKLLKKIVQSKELSE